MIIDDDRMLAAVSLVNRSGARGFEVGYLDDTPDARDARWWAKATYRGAALAVEDFDSPDAAADALARRILDGGQCTMCELTVVTADELVERAVEGLEPGDERCLWARHGRHWIAGCADPAAEVARLENRDARTRPGQPLNRAQRRKAGRRR